MRTNYPTVSTDASLREVAEILTKNNIGSVFVTEDKRVVGVVTERDVVRAIASGRDLEEIKVNNVMSAVMVMVHKDVPAKMALQLLKAYLIRRMPVVDEKGNLLGMISVTDMTYKFVPKILKPGMGRVEEIIRPLQKAEGGIRDIAETLIENGVDALEVEGKLVTERRIVKAYVLGELEEEPHIRVPGDLDLKSLAELMALNSVRFVKDHGYVSTREVAYAAAEMVSGKIKAYVLLRTRSGSEKEIMEKLKQHPNILNAELVTGPFDIVVTIIGESPNQVADIVTGYIRKIEDVLDSLTLVSSVEE